MQIVRVRSNPAAADGEACGRGARPAARGRAPSAVARGERVVGARAARTTTSAPGRSSRSPSAATARLTTARAPRSATASTRWRQPSSRRDVRVRAGDDERRAVLEVDAELAGARDDVLADGEVARHDRAGGTRSSGLRGRALRRAHPLDLGGDQRGHEAQQRGAGVRARPHPKRRRPARRRRAARACRRPRRRPAASARRPASGPATASTVPAAVEQHEARVERARRRADDLGEAGAGRDGVRDGVERAEVESGRRSLRPAWTLLEDS